MSNKSRTKKRLHKKYKKRKHCSSTLKYFGGALNSDQPPNEILNEVKKQHQFNLENSEIFKKTSELAQGIALTIIQNTGNLLGIDLSNSQSISESLDKIKDALSNPANREKIKEIVARLNDILLVALEAASPFIKQLIAKAFNEGGEVFSKFSEAAVKVALNTAEEIPGVGILIGTIRSLSTAGEAALSGANSMNELLTSTFDSANASVRNFKQIMKDKKDSLNRINTSVNNFQMPYNNPINKLPYR